MLTHLTMCLFIFLNNQFSGLHAHTCNSTYVEVQGQLSSVSSYLPTCWGKVSFLSTAQHHVGQLASLSFQLFSCLWSSNKEFWDDWSIPRTLALCVGSGQTQVKRPVWNELLPTESSQRFSVSFYTLISRSLFKNVYLWAYVCLCIPHVDMCLQKLVVGVGSPGTRVAGSCNAPSVGAGNPSYLSSSALCSWFLYFCNKLNQN